METKNKKNVEVEKEARKPTEKYSIFPITISVWENDGIKSYSIQKSYKDKNDEWANTSNFSEADLCVIAKILTQI